MPNVADELRAAGVHAIISPGDAGYADAIAGFDTGTVPAPDVVVDALRSRAARPPVAEELASRWGDPSAARPVRWPLTVLAGRT